MASLYGKFAAAASALANAAKNTDDTEALKSKAKSLGFSDSTIETAEKAGNAYLSAVSKNTGGSSSGGGTTQQKTAPSGYYVVDTPTGYDVLDKLDSGEINSFTSDKDGSTWRKTADGYEVTTKNGVNMTIAAANRPQKQKTDLEAFLEALNARDEDWEERQRQSEENTRQLIESFYANNEQRLKEENKYATEKAIREINDSIENSNQSYSQLIAQNAIDAARAADNLAYRNAAAGNLGGIGGALYSQQQASFDAQLGDIKNQQVALRQQADQQIAALEAQGEYELAAQISDVYEKKLESLMQLEDNILSNYENRTQTMQSYYYKGMETAWEQAKTRLQLGVLGPSDFAILGISEEDANDLADYFSNLADIDLAKAQTELDNLMIAGQQAQAKLADATGNGNGSNKNTGTGSSKKYGGMTQYEAYQALSGSGLTNREGLVGLLTAGYLGTALNRASAEELADSYLNFINNYGVDDNGNFLYNDQTPKGYDTLPITNNHTADSVQLIGGYMDWVNPEQLSDGLFNGSILKQVDAKGNITYVDNWYGANKRGTRDTSGNAVPTTSDTTISTNIPNVLPYIQTPYERVLENFKNGQLKNTSPIPISR